MFSNSPKNLIETDINKAVSRILYKVNDNSPESILPLNTIANTPTETVIRLIGTSIYRVIKYYKISFKSKTFY